MDIFRKHLFEYLRRSQINVEITGFDMAGFEEAMHRDLRRRLSEIAGIVYEDSGILPDSEKIEAIKLCLAQDPGE